MKRVLCGVLVFVFLASFVFAQNVSSDLSDEQKNAFEKGIDALSQELDVSEGIENLIRFVFMLWDEGPLQVSSVLFMVVTFLFLFLTFTKFSRIFSSFTSLFSAWIGGIMVASLLSISGAVRVLSTFLLGFAEELGFVQGNVLLVFVVAYGILFAGFFIVNILLSLILNDVMHRKKETEKQKASELFANAARLSDALKLKK